MYIPQFLTSLTEIDIPKKRNGDDTLKKLIAFLAFVFLLSFIVYSVNATEPRLIWNLDWEGLNVAIYAPYQAYPNDTMTIRIRVEARENLQDVTVRFRIYGSKSEGYLTWFNSFYALYNIDLSSGVIEDQYFNVSIPEDVDPGLIYSQTSCSWKVWRESLWKDQSNDGVFRVTYLRNKPYEELQVAYNQLLADYNSLQTSYSALQANHSALLTDYNELLADYHSLQSSFGSLQNDYNNLQTSYDFLNSTYNSLFSNYSSLQASFNELKSKYEFGGEMANALNLMYVFIETTVIFIATTIYFARVHIYSAIQKPRTKQKV